MWHDWSVSVNVNDDERMSPRSVKVLSKRVRSCSLTPSLSLRVFNDFNSDDAQQYVELFGSVVHTSGLAASEMIY